MKETFKKIGAMFALLLMLIGLVIAVMTLCKAQEYVALAGVILLGIAAVPSAIYLAKMLKP